MKNIIFMPFINDDTAIAWREDLENDFLAGEGKALTDEIKSIRAAKKGYESSGRLKDYYADLHSKKSPRQEMWLRKLIHETAAIFEKELKKLSGDGADPAKTTVVCALPEFYWCDINDNNKHKSDVEGYFKPLYLQNALKPLTEKNELMDLTDKYKNMIFFAGTAMWKRINTEDHNDEEIFNSLIVYADGKYKESISKHNVSRIDGFYGYDRLTDDFIKVSRTKKIGEATLEVPPVTEFNGMRFTYDICLDFICGKAGTKIAPLSTELCNKAGIGGIDVNILIAAGMPIDDTPLPNGTIPPGGLARQKIKSDILLRCDGLAPPHGQVFIKQVTTPGRNVAMIEIHPN